MESLSYAFEPRSRLFPDDIELQLRDKSVLNDQIFDDLIDEPNNESNDSEFGSRNSDSDMNLGQNLVPSGLKSDDLASSRKRNSDSFAIEKTEAISRSRVTNLQSHVLICQVLDCNEDLSSSKDYHKRHKVCDRHSKTAVVVVNGVQQRFCQQCSRFHVISEFDEGKRSCRKRLTGHNQRRRKPQLETQLGSAFSVTDLSKKSLLFSKILPAGFFQRLNGIEKHENFLDPKFSFQDLTSGSNSSSASSLLSAQSQNSSSNSPGKGNDHSAPSNVGSEGANTVDLLQLSLHLQRVEHQKYYTEAELENGIFYHSSGMV